MVEPTWLASARDNRSHAFEHVDEVNACEALCEHTVPPNLLSEPIGAPRCLACLLIHGGDLEAKHGDRHRLM